MALSLKILKDIDANKAFGPCLQQHQLIPWIPKINISTI